MIQRNRKAKSRRGRRGSEVLELALLLPILLGLALGACTYGWYFYLQHNVQAAAREGARAGIPFGATQADAEAKIAAYLTNSGLSPGDYSISITPNIDTAAPGDDITVTVESTWSTVGIQMLPQAMGGISGDKLVRGRAVMRKEG